MAETSFDIIIIGSGPGGYVTAIRAAQLGLKTAIVEREYLGGICLNWGCIPTKALLRSAEIMRYMQHAKEYGLSAEKVSYDAAAVVKRSRAVSKRLNDGVGFLMKKNKVTVIWGEAEIDAPGKISVKPARGDGPKGALGAGTYQCQHVIIAEAGLFKGHASTENADVHGRFEGELVVRKRLLIRAGGHVSGKITYGEIEIEAGGAISGAIEVATTGKQISMPLPLSA